MMKSWRTWVPFGRLEEAPLRGFYLILILNTATYFPRLAEETRRLSHTNLVWVWNLLSPLYTPGGVYAVFWMGLATFTIAAFFPRPWPVRFFSGIFCLLIISLKYNFGIVNHSQNAWVMAALLWALPWRRLSAALILAKIFIFSTYINSGIWKLRSLALYFFSEEGSLSLTRTLSDYIALTAFEMGRNAEGLLAAAGTLGNAMGAIWILIVLLQLSFVIPILRPRWELNFAVLAVLFHVGAFFILGINFQRNIVLIAWIFFAMRPAKNAAQ